MAGRNERAGGISPQLWIEVFAILNIGFLTFDIYLAHSVNQFRNRAEYIPLFFSATAPVVLMVGTGSRKRRRGLEVLGYCRRMGGRAGRALPE